MRDINNMYRTKYIVMTHSYMILHVPHLFLWKVSFCWRALNSTYQVAFHSS